MDEICWLFSFRWGFLGPLWSSPEEKIMWLPCASPCGASKFCMAIHIKMPSVAPAFQVIYLVGICTYMTLLYWRTVQSCLYFSSKIHFTSKTAAFLSQAANARSRSTLSSDALSPLSADIYCNATFDSVLCWPPTTANSSVSQACPNTVKGFDLSSKYTAIMPYAPVI